MKKLKVLTVVGTRPEIIRKIGDHISDINLTYSDIAREYLLREGFPADRRMMCGGVGVDILIAHRNHETDRS